MKSLLILVSVFISTSSLLAQKAKTFDVKKFENELIYQMEITFPNLSLDTTLNFVTRATSQEEAKFHESHANKKGGMVNTNNDEIEEAILLVKGYKKHLEENLHFDEKALIRCRFTEFCATATEQYGGLVRYGIVIDNNITRESLYTPIDELFQKNN